MTTCGPSGPNCGCDRPNFSGCSTLAEMVDRFLAVRAGLPDNLRCWYGNPSLSLDEACHRAMFTFGREGVRDGHQRFFSNNRLALLGADIGRAAKSWPRLESFGQLYRLTERALGLRQNQWPLLVYDVSLRLGCRFGISPEEVYLHAGPRTGANNLRTGQGNVRHRPLADFPTSIRTRLTAELAEDFLCLAAPHLKGIPWD